MYEPSEDKDTAQLKAENTDPEPQDKTEFEKLQELDKNLFYPLKSDAQSLQALNEALAPPAGDVVITVETYDRALIWELWTLQSEDVEITEQLQKAGDVAGLVWIVIRDVAAAATALKATTSAVNETVTIVERILKMIQSQTNGDKTKAKTKIRSQKNPVEILKLLNQFEKDVDAVVDVPDNEQEGHISDPQDS